MIRILSTYAIGLIGVAAFYYADLPLPWLLGPIAACLLAAVAGLPLNGNRPIGDAMRSVLGLAAGATFTPVVLASIPTFWPTLMLVPAFVGCIGFVGVPYFQRVCGYDFPTAYFSAMPGGLQDMLIFGEEAGGNTRALTLIHATRVMVIVVALPFILKGVWQADLVSPPGLPAANIPLPQLALMAFCAFGGWWIAKRVGLFGAAILGPLIAAACLTVAGILEHRPPAELVWAAQFFIGVTIGSKYVGITLAEIRRDLLAGIGFCLLLLILTVIFVEIVYNLDLAPGMEALLAFAPGGQAELTVLALIVGADMAFIVSHHVLRLFVVILGAPIAVRYFSPKPPD